MKKEKNMVMVLLCMVMLTLLICCIVLTIRVVDLNTKVNDKESVDNNVQVQENINYTYKEIKGLYTGKDNNTSYSIYLYDNGTFNYVIRTEVPTGYLGNYIIEDGKIKLNYLFKTNSGVDVRVTNGAKTLLIAENNVLKDGDISIEKSSQSEESEFLKGNDFSNILNNYSINNEVTDKVK